MKNRCQFYKKTITVNWLNLENSKEEVEMKCDGITHTWKDKKDRDWAVKCPVEFARAQENWILKYLKEVKFTLENFKTDTVEQKNVYEEVTGILKNLKERKFLLIGNRRTGKTHLVKALFCEICYRGSFAVYYTAIALAKIFSKSEGFDESACSKLSEIYDSKWLIIDDLDTERLTESGVFQEQFKELLDEYTGKIIITSNNGILKMRYDERIKDRLKEESKEIYFVGEPYDGE